MYHLNIFIMYYIISSKPFNSTSSLNHLALQIHSPPLPRGSHTTLLQHLSRTWALAFFPNAVQFRRNFRESSPFYIQFLKQTTSGFLCTCRGDFARSNKLKRDNSSIHPWSRAEMSVTWLTTYRRTDRWGSWGVGWGMANVYEGCLRWIPSVPQLKVIKGIGTRLTRLLFSYLARKYECVCRAGEGSLHSFVPRGHRINRPIRMADTLYSIPLHILGDDMVGGRG